MVRVRIAPSPTGIPHIGNTRTALFNYLFAKHNNGTFIVRIEDTDRARFVAESEKVIYEILQWLGMGWDETYKQSERLTIYKQHAQMLLDFGVAYQEEGAIRFRMPKESETTWQDAIGNKKITFQNKDQEDFVLLKSDGYPTYNFANVVDDHLMNITHVIRGDEFISSTPKHIQLYKAFSWVTPLFAHLPVIVGADKAKLSKRHGAKSALEYRDEGFLPQALLNFMALLGWNPGGDREIMDINTMINLFDLKDVNTASPMFDMDKLKWMNGIYIRQLTTDELKSKIKNQKSKVQVKIQNLSDNTLDKLIELAQSRMKTLNDFDELVEPWFEKISLEGEEKKQGKKLHDVLFKVQSWNAKSLLLVLQAFCQHEEGVNMKDVYRLVTGKEQGLPLADMMEILGKEESLARFSPTSF